MSQPEPEEKDHRVIEVRLDDVDVVSVMDEDRKKKEEDERIMKLALQMVRGELQHLSPTSHRSPIPTPRTPYPTPHPTPLRTPIPHQEPPAPQEDTGTGSLSGIGSRNSLRHPHRYKCCCCEMDGPVINYSGKLMIGLSVLFFCFVQIHRSSEDFAAYMTLMSAVLGVFISTPKMKRQKE